MKKLFFLLAVISGINCAAQNQMTDHVQNMIEVIDSIAKANDIVLGMVYVNKTTSDIGQVLYHFKNEFRFAGHFLVIEDNYLNMDKLLYFVVKKKYIEFTFQK